MNRIKKAFASAALTIGLIGGGAILAAPAQAWTATGACVVRDAGSGYVFYSPSGSGRYAEFCQFRPDPWDWEYWTGGGYRWSIVNISSQPFR